MVTKTSISKNEQFINDKIFLRQIEKRVRKDIRINNKIGKEKLIKLYDDKSKEFRVAKEILREIFGKVKEIKISKIKTRDSFIPTNLDREIRKDFESYLNNSNFKTKPKLILQNLKEEEIVKYCNIKNLEIGQIDKKNILIEKFEEKTPNTKFSLAKSFERIRKNLKNETKKNN